MQPKTVVRTEAVIEILSFGVGAVLAIFASVKETEIWSSQCTPRVGNECPVGATCPIPNARCPSDDPPSWDEGRLEAVWETIRCALNRFVQGVSDCIAQSTTLRATLLRSLTRTFAMCTQASRPDLCGVCGMELR